MKIENFQACSLHIAYSNSYVRNLKIILNFHLANDYVFSLTIEQKFRYILFRLKPVIVVKVKLYLDSSHMTYYRRYAVSKLEKFQFS